MEAGNGDVYCGTGCQPKFGTCSGSTAPAPGNGGDDGGNAPPSGGAGDGDAEGNVPGLGFFTNYKKYTFETNSWPADLMKSNYVVKDTEGNENARFDHSFVPNNVAIEGGFMVLTVPGAQKSSPILSGEVQTAATNIQYGSFRTKAILTSEPGVVDGWYLLQFSRHTC